MKMDELTRFENAYKQLVAMGFEEDELKSLLSGKGKGELKQISQKEAIDTMVLYFRAKRLLSSQNVQNVISQREQLKSPTTRSKDVEALSAYAYFVDVLEQSTILKNIGSGKQLTLRDWDAYFKEKGDKYKKDLRNKGEATRRQVDTLEDIERNPFDYRLRDYLEQYMSDQTKADITYAVNDSPATLAVVRGLPFAVGKNKQESYTDVVLKYLYAETKLSSLTKKAEKLEEANKALKLKLAQKGSIESQISASEAVVLMALKDSSEAVAKLFEQASAENAGIIERIESTADETSRMLASLIITNGKARKAENEGIKIEVRDSARRTAENVNAHADENTQRINAHADENTQRIIDAVNNAPRTYTMSAPTVSSYAMSAGSSETNGIIITNARANKKEHKKTQKAVKGNKVLTSVALGLAGAAAFGTFGNLYYMINNSKKENELPKDNAPVGVTEGNIPGSLLAFFNAQSDEERMALYNAEQNSDIKNIMGQYIEALKEETPAITSEQKFLKEYVKAYEDGIISLEELESLTKFKTEGENLTEGQIAVNLTIKAMSDLNKLQGDYSVLEASYAEIEGVSQTLQTSLNQAKEELKTLKSTTISKNEHDAIVAELENKIAQFETVIEGLNAQLEANETEKKQLLTQIEELKAQGIADQATIQALETKVSTLETKAEADKNTIDALNTEVAGLKQNVTTLTGERDQHKAEADANKAEANANKAEADAYKAEVEELKRIIEGYKTEIESLKQQIANGGDKEALTNELNAIKGELSNILTACGGDPTGKTADQMADEVALLLGVTPNAPSFGGSDSPSFE